MLWQKREATATYSADWLDYKDVNLKFGYGVKLAMARFFWLRRTLVQLWPTEDGYGSFSAIWLNFRYDI